ncbi:MAG: hypothetical protein ACTHU0_28360 [Kofleriaceae bacterium]
MIAVEVFCLALAELWCRLPDLLPFEHGDVAHPHVWIRRDDGYEQCSCGLFEVDYRANQLTGLAETFRRRLGLRHFGEVVRDSRALALVLAARVGWADCPRRCGRTTRDLLHAIAACVERGDRTLTIVGTYSSPSISRHAAGVAREMIEALGLDIEVQILRFPYASRSSFVSRYRATIEMLSTVYIDHAHVEVAISESIQYGYQVQR